jgi:hypothetical protein
MTPTTELAARIALWWMDRKPIKHFREQRKRKRRLKELGLPEEGGMALDLGTRTSTNTVVGSPILGVVYVNVIQMLPYPELVAALTTPESVVLATAAFAWLVARFSKTPDQPGKL